MEKNNSYSPKIVGKNTKRYKLIITSLCATIFLFLTPTPANAVELTASGTPYGYGNGYKNVLQGKDAFQRLFKVGSTIIPVYSTSFKGSVPTDPAIKFQAIQRMKTNLENTARGSNVAASSSIIGTPLRDANSEAVAVQLALWHLLEGVEIKSVGQINQPIMVRAEELIEISSSVNTPERAVAVNIEIVQERISGGTRASITLSANGKALPGEYITVNAGNVSLQLLTNDAGIALAKLPGFNLPTTLSASFKWSLAAGSILIPPSGASIITAEAATIVSKSSAKIPVTSNSVASSKPTSSVSKPSAKPTQSPTPTPSVSAKPELSLSPIEPVVSSEFEDPAAAIIDVVVEKEKTADKSNSAPKWITLVGVGILFLVALGIARQRLKE